MSVIRDFFLSIVLATSASAADLTDRVPCNPEGTQTEMNSCAISYYKEADRKLNETYKKVMAGLSKQEAALLRNIQRKWVEEKEPACRLEAKDSEGGSIWPMEFYGCLQRITEKRNIELNELLSMQTKAQTNQEDIL